MKCKPWSLLRADHCRYSCHGLLFIHFKTGFMKIWFYVRGIHQFKECSSTILTTDSHLIITVKMCTMTIHPKSPLLPLCGPSPHRAQPWQPLSASFCLFCFYCNFIYMELHGISFLCLASLSLLSRWIHVLWYQWLLFISGQYTSVWICHSLSCHQLMGI